MVAKKELTADDFTVEVADNAKAVITLGTARLEVDGAGLSRIMKALARAATVVR